MARMMLSHTYNKSIVLLVLFVCHLHCHCDASQDRPTSIPACSLNGQEDANGNCVCDKPWTGTECASLDFLPVKFPQGYGVTPNQTTWGADILTQTANGQPRFHMFVSVMTGGCSLRSWTKNSRIEHAVAETITGPYHFQNVALPTFSHNPKIVTLPDREKTLALIHLGDGTGPEEGPTCKSQQQQQQIAEERLLGNIQTTDTDTDSDSSAVAQGSTIHIASSVDGPWIPLLNSTLPKCDNPAPFVHRQDSSTNKEVPSAIYIVCKPAKNQTLLLRAEHIWGPWTTMSQITPDKQYHQKGDSSIDSSSTIVYEDPSLYIDHRGFHVLFHVYNTNENPPHGHDCTNTTISAHWFSKDGIAWHKSPGQPFRNHIKTTNNDGETLVVATRERPSLVFGTNPTTGRLQPTHLVTATCSASRCPNGPPPGCVDCKYDHWDYTLVQPLNV